MTGFDTVQTETARAAKDTRAAFQERLKNSAEAIRYILIQRKIEPLVKNDLLRIQQMIRGLESSAAGFGFEAVATACADAWHVLGDLIAKYKDGQPVTDFQYPRLEKSLTDLQSIILHNSIGEGEAILPSKHAISSPYVQEILIVDDDKELAGIVSLTLQQKGYRITVAGDGETALRQIQARKFDLVVLDIDLPGMNGHNVLKLLKQDPALVRTPVLMLTGHSDHKYVIDALYSGAADYVSKPVNTAVVSAKVDKILNAIPVLSGGKQISWNSLKLEE